MSFQAINCTGTETENKQNNTCTLNTEKNKHKSLLS